MKTRTWIAPAVAAAAALAVGCGGDSTGVSANVIPAELVGTWVANSTCSPACNFILTSDANPAATIDLVAGGFPATFSIQAGGTASLSIGPSTQSGTAHVSGNTLYLSSGGSTDTLDYVATPTQLTVQIHTAVTSFDFTGDGIPDSAHARAVLKKQ